MSSVQSSFLFPPFLSNVITNQTYSWLFCPTCFSDGETEALYIDILCSSSSATERGEKNSALFQFSPCIFSHDFYLVSINSISVPIAQCTENQKD